MRHLTSFGWKTSLLCGSRRGFYTTPQCNSGSRLKTAKDRKEHFFTVNSWKANDESNDIPVVADEKRLPKKKVALMLGYNGSGYQGMQANPGTKSLEGELFDALCKAGAISKSNAIDPKKVQLMRAARTDKGVHAACNLVSLKMICSDDKIVQKLNDLLPNHFRIWGYVETQRSFHAKTKCDSRIYEYLLPSYTLQKLGNLKEHTIHPTSDYDHKIMTENGTVTRYIAPTDPTLLKEFRVSQSQLENFRSAMAKFEGTHNFHNYTRGREFKDPASKRFMIDIRVEDPILIEGTEWLSVKLHGQSFMLHQIRKMISMAMYSVRTASPLSLIDKTFEADKLNIPKAPALGLLLDRPVFQLYNDRMKTVENRPSIDFDVHKEKIQKFKEQYIYSRIFQQEERDKEFDAFLAAVDSHLDSTYNYFINH